ncbi:MAG: hypothetical protein GXY42_12735 [Desulfovibrionales bacterium]|nr:hypothetical protein [Desulfovibrionales bacterium]
MNQIKILDLLAEKRSNLSMKRWWERGYRSMIQDGAKKSFPGSAFGEKMNAMFSHGAFQAGSD